MTSLVNMKASLEAAKLRALIADRKARVSGDPLDYAAAENAWSQAANAAHVIGIESDVPKPERDKYYQLGVRLNKNADGCKREAEQIRSKAYQDKKDRWSRRDTLGPSMTHAGGSPPTMMNVLDNHGGFTAVTKPPRWLAGARPKFAVDPRAWLGGDTVWRPGSLLKSTTNGTLKAYEPKSFYQTNNNVTMALYRVPGYQYPVAVWFDNASGQRIA